MKKVSFSLFSIFLVCACFFIWACQKGINWDEGTTAAPPVITPGTTASDYGWSSKVNDTAFHGCTDTAYYQSAGPVKALQIVVTDSAGDNIVFSLVSTSGNFSAGTYGSAAGTGAIVFTSAGNSSYTVSATGDVFVFQATTINDTIVTGTFNATISNAYSTKIKITEGKIKALIGKANPCAGNTAGNTGGGVDTSAAFSLVRSGSNCSFVVVKGSYVLGRDLNATNTAQVQVNVTRTGKYSITTASVKGMSFFVSGTFTMTGNQTLTLTGSGNPTVTGLATIPITTSSTSCDFTVLVQ